MAAFSCHRRKRPTATTSARIIAGRFTRFFAGGVASRRSRSNTPLADRGLTCSASKEWIRREAFVGRESISLPIGWRDSEWTDFARSCRAHRRRTAAKNCAWPGATCWGLDHRADFAPFKSGPSPRDSFASREYSGARTDSPCRRCCCAGPWPATGLPVCRGRRARRQGWLSGTPLRGDCRAHRARSRGVSARPSRQRRNEPRRRPRAQQLRHDHLVVASDARGHDGRRPVERPARADCVVAGEEGIDGRRIAVWGDSFAVVHPPQRNLSVPFGIDDEPEPCEPIGARR